jgi:acetylornithine deacetylase/succinyl-diaminopimelate desuccinylase-like protein
MQVGKIAVKLDPQSDLAVRSHQVLETALGRAVEKIVWRFCTDGSSCAELDIPIFGFGPGDPELAHTSYERVAVAELKEAVVGNAALAMSPVLAT